MSISTVRDSPQLASFAEETTVGIISYRITRPSPFGNPSGRGIAGGTGASARAGDALGIYVHIPFCRKRCHFCYFKVYTDKDSAAIRNYLDAVTKELSFYAGKPVIGGARLTSFILGAERLPISQSNS